MIWIRKTIQRLSRSVFGRAVFIAVALFPFTSVYADDPQIISGTASIEHPDANTTNITAANGTILEWNNFGIPSGQTMNFFLPDASSTLLNRSTGDQASHIDGNLWSNANLVLVNTNGIFFGATAAVEVGGLIASTLDIKNENFLAGQYLFGATDQTIDQKFSSVVNQGLITAANGGHVALIGSAVANEGVIRAPLGHVALASGDVITIGISPDNSIVIGIDVAVSHEVLDANGQPVKDQVSQTGQIIAPGGTVELSAKAAHDLFDRAVNQTGIVRAADFVEKDGVIEILGTGPVQVSGVLDAGEGTVTVSSENSVVVAQDDPATEEKEELVTTGDTTIAADKDIRIKGDLTTNRGDINLLADNDLDGQGAYLQDAGTTVKTVETGDIRITSSGASTIANIEAAGDLSLEKAGADAVYTQQPGSKVVTGGSLTIGQGVTLAATDTDYEVAKDWKNEGLFLADLSHVHLVGNLESGVYGQNVFNDFTVNAPGKLVRFESDVIQEVLGVLTLKGAFGRLLVLDSIDPSRQWKILPKGVTDIQFCHIGNSINARGPPLEAQHSDSLGNNTNWSIAIRWTGDGLASFWSDPSNWDTGTIPVLTSNVLFDGASGPSSQKDSVTDTAFQGMIESITLNGYTGILTLARDLTVKGDFNHQTGGFDPVTFRVTFIDNTRVSHITGNTAFYDLTCVTPGKRLVFEAGSMTTVLNDLTLEGAEGSRIILESSIAAKGSEFGIWIHAVKDAQGNLYADYIEVYYSTAFGPVVPILAKHYYIPAELNTDWDDTHTWTGTTSNLWNLDANWGGTKPSAGDDLVFPSSASNKSTSNDFAADTSFNSITFEGSGYTLAGSAITLAGNITDSSGSGTNTISLNMAMAADRTISVASGGNLSISGVISGAGGLIKTGAGTIVLSGNNTYTGTTTINNGTLSASNIVVSGGACGSGGMSNLGCATSAVVLGDGSNKGILSYTGNDAVYTRGLTVSAGGGEIDVTTSGQLLSMTTNELATSGTLTFGGAGNQYISAVISGSGGITIAKSSNGYVGLDAANTYTGVTTINSGYLYLYTSALSGSASALGNATSDVLLGDTSGSGTACLLSCGGNIERNITVRAGSSGVAFIRTSCGSTITVSGNITLNKDATLTTNSSSDSMTISGVISGSYSIAKSGPGPVTLSGNNTYTGTTTIYEGVLSASNIVVASGYSNLGNAATPVVLGDPTNKGTLSYTGNDANYTRGFTVNAGGGEVDVTTSGKTLTIMTGGISTSGTFTVGGVGRAYLYSVISGTGSFTKTGSGDMWLYGTHSYTGTTLILAGTIYLNVNAPSGSDGGFGNATSDVLIGDTSGTSNAYLIILGAYTVGRNITVQSGSSGSASLGSFTAGAAAFSGNITLQKNITLDIMLTGTTTFSGVISGGFQVTKTGSGTALITGANTYTGQTIVYQGTLLIGADAPSGSAGALGNATSAVVLGEGWGSNPASILTNGAFTVARPIIVYSGSSGTMTIGGYTADSSTFSGAITLNKDVTLTAASGGNVTLSGVISGGFNVTKSGAGTVTLSGNNTYTGTTTIANGTLSASNIVVASGYSNLGNAATPVVLGDTTNQGILSYTGNSATYTRGFTINAGGGEIDVTTSGQTLGVGTGGIVTSGALTIGGNGNTSISSVISGSGSLTVATTGVSGALTLSGTNTYTGITTVKSRYLFISAEAPSGAPGALGNATSDVLLGDTSGSLSAEIYIWDSHTVARNITIRSGSSGSAILGDCGVTSSSTFSGNITLGKNLTLYTTSGNTCAFSGVISGSYGVVSNTAGGTNIFSGPNTYTGTTIVNSGTLLLGTNAPSGSAGALGNATSAVLLGNTSGSSAASLLTNGAYTVGRDITVRSGSSGTATIGGNTADTSTFSGAITLNKDVTLTAASGGTTMLSGVISGGFNVTKSGAGTVTLSGNNTYTGVTTIANGTLSAANIVVASGYSNLGNAATPVVLGDATNKGILSYTGNSATYTRGFTVSAGGGEIDVTTSGQQLTLNTGGISTSGVITFGGAGGFSNSSVISGTGGVTWAMSGMSVTHAASTYGGVTTVLGYITCGTDALAGQAGAFGNAASDVLVGDATHGGTINIRYGNFTVGRNITVQAGSSGSIYIMGNWSGTQTFSGNITLDRDSHFIEYDAAGTTVFSGVISGGSNVLISGDNYGTVIFSGANTYTGTTTVNGGKLLLGANAPSGSAGALGNSTGAVLLGDTSGSTSAAIYTNGAFTIGRDITVRSGSSGTATIGGNTADTSTFSGAITLNKDVTLTAASGGTTTLSGVISGGFNVTKSGAGTVTLSGNNTYTGTTTISNGTLSASNIVVSGGYSNLGNASSALILGDATNKGILSYTGNSATYTRGFTISAGGGEIDNLNNNSLTIATGGIVANGLLTIGGTKNTTITSVISGAGGLTKSSISASLTLSGNNSYTGTTTLDGGGVVTITLNAPSGANGAFGNATSDILIGDTTGGSVAVYLLISGSYTIERNITTTVGSGSVYLGSFSSSGTVTFSGNITNNERSWFGLVSTPGETTVFSGVIAGNKGVRITNGIGSGSGGTVLLSGVNTFTGTTTIEEGTLLIGTNAPSGSAGALGNSTGAVLLGDGVQSSGDHSILTNGDFTVGRDITVQSSGAGSAYIGGNTSNNSTFSGNITLQKDATLTAAASGNVTLSGVISGGFNVTKSGAGTVTLSGNNTYTGVTTIANGTLSASNIVVASGYSNLGNASSAVVLGDATNKGTLSYTGNSATYTRGFTINAGGGEIDNVNNNSLTIATGGIVANGLLTIGGVKNTIITSVISGSGGLTLNSATDVSLRLSGTNTYTGVTSILAGTLFVDTNAPSGAPGALGNATSDVLLGNTSGSSRTELMINGAYIVGRNITVQAGGSGIPYIGSNSADAVVTGNVTVNYSLVGVAAWNGGTTLTLSGVISGVGGVTVSAANMGQVILTGTNTYTGLTTINGGTLIIGADAPSGSNGALGNATSAILLGYTSGIADAFILTNGAYTIARSITVRSGNSGVMGIGGNSAHVSLFTGDITLNKDVTLTAVSGGNATFSGIISGDFNLTKVGAGSATLSGVNTYTGTTTVNVGYLMLAGNAPNGSAGTLGNATNDVIISATTAVDAYLFAAGSYTIARNITINNGGVGGSTGIGLGSTSATAVFSGNITLLYTGILDAWDAGAVVTFSGNISGSGGIYGSSANLGKVILSGAASNYTGDTTINSGTFLIGSNAALGATSAVYLGRTSGTADAYLLMNGVYTCDRSITVRSGSTGVAYIGGNTANNSTFSGNITLQKDVTLTAVASGNVTVSGVISGGFNVTKSGAGTVTLSGNNTYTGVTTIANGTLSASNIVVASGYSNLGNASSAVVLGDATNKGILSYTGNSATYTRGFTINAGGGEIDNASNNSLTIATGNISNSSGMLSFGGAGNITINSVIGSGAGGLTKTGSGILVLAGANTYSGTTTLSAGQLNINNASGIGTGTLVIENGTTIGCSAGSGNIVLSTNNPVTLNGDFTFVGWRNLNLGTGTVTLTGNRKISVSTNTSYILTFGGAIVDGGNGYSLRKDGIGHLTLAGPGTYSGGTILDEGYLNINHATAIGTGTLTINGGGLGKSIAGSITLSNNNPQIWNNDFSFYGSVTSTTLYMGTGSVTLNNDIVLTFVNSAWAGQLSIGGVISGAHGLTVTGSLINALILSGANDFSGGFTLTDGWVQTNNNSALGTGRFTINGGNLTNSTGATITLANDMTWNGDWEIGYTSTPGIISFTGPVTLGADVTISGNNGWGKNFDFQGQISGDHKLLIGDCNNSSGFTISGANIFTGGLTLNHPNAHLVLNNAAGLGTGPLTINDGGVIRTTLGGGLTVSTNNEIYLNGHLNNWAMNQPLNLGTGNITLGANSTITVGSSTLTLGGNISGAYSLIKLGAGTLALSGNNSYSGGTTVTAGTLNVNHANALGVGDVLMDGGTLVANTDLNVGGSWTRSSGTFTHNNYTVTFNGAGTQILNPGGASFRGLVHSGAGTLQLTNALTAATTFMNSLGIFDANGQTVSVTGLTTISGGEYKTSTATQTLNGGLTVSGGAIITGNSGNVNITGALTLVNGTMTGTSGVFTASSYDVQSGSISAILGGSGSLTKTTEGTVTLSGNNTYTGTTTIANGTLSASNIAVASGYSNLGNASSAVVLGDATNKGILSYTGNSATYTRGFTINAGGGEVDVTTSGQTLTIGTNGITATGTLTKGGAGTLAQAMNLSLGGNLSVSAGTWAISTYDLAVTGNSDVTGGTVTVGASSANGWSTTDMTIGTGGVVTCSGASKITASGDWDMSLGTWTRGDSTVNFIGTSNVTSGGQPFNHVSIGGTAAAGAVTVTALNMMTVAGNLTVDNTRNTTLDLTNQTLNVAGNLDLTNLDTFTSTGSTVTLNGSGTSVISGNSTFNNLSCITAGKHLTFTVGSTQTINGTLTLTGTAGSAVVLRSSSEGNYWNVNNVGNTASVSYVNVKDSNNTGSTITAPASTNSGHNIGWDFLTPPAPPAPNGGALGTAELNDSLRCLYMPLSLSQQFLFPGDDALPTVFLRKLL